MALSVPMGMGGPRIRVLLGSGGVATDDRRETHRRLVGEHFSGCERVLFVPYASSDHALYTSRMQGFTGPDGPELVGIESLDDPVSAVSDAEGIYVGGGNSFLLVRELHESGLIEPIRDAVMGGAPYLGVSAGSNVASPSMMTTNDMPIVHPPSFSSLGVVPFQINPHYHPGKIRFMDGDELAEHFGESRAQRISEFHLQDQTPVLGMWEGSYAHWDGAKGVLTGRATAFLAGEEPTEMHDGMEFDSTLSPC